MRNRLCRVSATAEATDDRHSFLSGTVLRCTPFHHTSPGRGPGLTENGSALRTGTSALVSMLPTDRVSGHDTHALVSMLLTDRVSGHAFS